MLIDVQKQQDVKQLCKALLDTNSVWLEKSSFDRVFDIVNGVMPVVLIPQMSTCHLCNGALKTDSRPSILSVYANNGRQYGHSYHKKCSDCGLLIYYSYSRTTNGSRTFYAHSSSKPYFMISSKTAFSDDMVKLCAVQAEITMINFDSMCNQYLALTGDELDKQRVEEMYFLHRLIETYSEFDELVQVTTSEETYRKDIESLCKNAIENMVTLNNLSEDHQCNVPGCREGFIMADGVEKVC